VEHKSYLDAAIFIQLLGYMVLMWQEDLKNKVPLRLIIPVVFYHGESKWTIPLSFVDKFEVDKEVKKYLLDFRYILFDTSEKDLWAEENRDLKENLYFFTSMVMMKHAFNQNLEEIKRMFRLWVEKEFYQNPEVMQFVLTYLAQTGNIERETLEKMLDESKLDGGAIMETLYQKIENEGIQKGIQEGKQEGKQEVVLNAFEKGLPEDTIASITGFSMKEIRKMQKAWFSTKKSHTTH
jgi:predicted transposase/invertase (TIGR01784 family)